MIPEQLVNITAKLLYFFVPELLIWIFILKKGNRFSFRFSSIEGHSQLKPFAKTWIVAIVILFITIFSQDIFEFFIGQTIHNLLIGLGFRLILITLALTGFSFLWVYNYLLEKRMDKISWSIIVITIILGIIFFST